MNVFTLKENMLLGLSSPALQCEGGELESSWIYWWGLGSIRDGASPAVAAQHIQHWQEDTALLRTLGVTAHRMGIDWTRVEPREEEFDEAALARYRAELSALRDAGIRVQLELHHFNEPVWFSERGGFEKVENFSCYLHYIEHVVAGRSCGRIPHLCRAERLRPRRLPWRRLSSGKKQCLSLLPRPYAHGRVPHARLCAAPLPSPRHGLR